MCDGNMLSRAPGIRIGLVNVIMCGFIYNVSNYMSEMDSDAPSWEMLA